MNDMATQPARKIPSTSSSSANCFTSPAGEISRSTGPSQAISASTSQAVQG